MRQSEDLCGGAAAAMVMRYWGARGVYAETFAPLVDRSAHGIRTAALAEDVRRRGWTVVAGPGGEKDLSREVARGRPVIALIEDRPHRYHYVVVIAADAARLVVHDPARGPSRPFSADAFDAAWEKAGRWMAIVLPGSDAGSRDAARAEPERDREVARDSTPSNGGSESCGIDAAVRAATSSGRAAGRAALEAAAASCPADSAPWRELAGLDALDGDWIAAASHARLAIRLDPRDAFAWRLLATSEYLTHRDTPALAAWNRVGEPLIDLVDITGLRSTRYDAIADAMDLRPGRLLTADALRLAERRAASVPSIAAARVAFHPVENGRAQVDAAVIERDRAPTSYPAWIAMGLDAGANRQVDVAIASPSGGGDVFDVSWRWWRHRPMVAASYAAPGPRALGGGVWKVSARRETQTFAVGSRQQEETRTAAGVDIAYWLTSRTRVSGSAGIESWRDRGRSPSVGVGMEFRPVPARLALDARATAWRGFEAGDVRARWRSRPPSLGVVWLASGGFAAASTGAPLTIWPRADAGHAGDVLLRAHPLLEDGIVTPGVVARRLAFWSAEVQRWYALPRWPLRFAPAAFVDAARAARTVTPSPSAPRAQIDVGAGLRVSPPLGSGAIRIDVAHGLRDGRTALSIAWTREDR